MTRVRIVITVILLLLSGATYGKNELEVVVADPFIELHTGPGGGYPIFHVVDRGETIIISKRRTSWYKCETADGKQGWVSAEQLSRTLDIAGEPTEIDTPDRQDYIDRRLEIGFQVGDFDGANAISAYAGWLFTRNLSAEVFGTHLSGDFSDGWLIGANLIHQPFPTWFVSPFFALGTGILHIEPKSTLVQSEDRTDQEAHVGFGVRSYLNERFLVRAEYRSYVVFTKRDSNEEVDEWRIGFAFFF